MARGIFEKPFRVTFSNTGRTADLLQSLSTHYIYRVGYGQLSSQAGDAGMNDPLLWVTIYKEK